MHWYNFWVREQLASVPKDLLSAITAQSSESDQHWFDQFSGLWEEVSKCMQTEKSPCIDSLISRLINAGTIRSDNTSDALHRARNLVFAIIGCQTMLYKVDFGSSHPSRLAIVDELDGFRCHSHMVLKQNHSACRRPMPEFLMGFGVLLPPLNFCAHDTEEDKKNFQDLKSIAPAFFNAFLLSSIGHVEIKWTDSLACHMELDSIANILYLFRFPSFCIASILIDDTGKPHKSGIHACAAPETGSRQWATSAEVTQMLHETLLSYRLLFGQAKTARRLFRKLEPFEGIPVQGRDEVLTQLCSRKRCSAISQCQERDIYNLARDFPILRSRLSILTRHLSLRKPRSWRELWQDKRDSAQWFTFWAVLVIGGLGIMLAFMQVILQIVQIAIQRSRKK